MRRGHFKNLTSGIEEVGHPVVNASLADSIADLRTRTNVVTHAIQHRSDVSIAYAFERGSISIL